MAQTEPADFLALAATMSSSSACNARLRDSGVAAAANAFSRDARWTPPDLREIRSSPERNARLARPSLGWRNRGLLRGHVWRCPRARRAAAAPCALRLRPVAASPPAGRRRAHLPRGRASRTASTSR